MGSSGETYNINADTVAAAIAVALEARKVIFMTDVDGVLSDGKELISYLDTATAENLIANKDSGGMVLKFRPRWIALKLTFVQLTSLTEQIHTL